MKPKLFQDVDGVLLVDQSLPGYVRIDYDGKSYWYDPATPGRMAKLNDLFNIVWSSHSWHGKENTVLSPLFNLPNDLDVLKFTPIPVSPEHDLDPQKLKAIEALGDDKPMAIFDDRIGETVEAWAADRICLLVKPDHAVGMTEGHFNLLRAFGEMYSLDDQPSQEMLREFGFMELKKPSGDISLIEPGTKFPSQFHKDFATVWLKIHGKNEALFAADCRKFLVLQGKGILGKLKLALASGEQPTADDLFDPRAYDDLVRSMARPHLLRAMFVGAVAAQQFSKGQMPQAKDAEDALLQLNPRIVAAIRKSLDECLRYDYWDHINDTTKDNLSGAIAKAIHEGATNREIVKRVQKALIGTAADRALTISRTEVTGALNAGQHSTIEDMIDEGMAEASEWLTTLDEFTREWHWDANGQKSENGMFTVGGEQCRYPGDPKLSAKNRIHCRCSLLSVLAGDKQKRLDAPQTKAKTFTLFFYGTLKLKRLLMQVVGHSIDDETTAMLHGYRKVGGYFDGSENDGKFHDIIASEFDEVFGKKVEVSRADLKKIDAWEDRYERKPVTLADGTQAQAYFMKEEFRSQLNSSDSI